MRLICTFWFKLFIGKLHFKGEIKICTFWLTGIMYSLIYSRTKAMGCVVQIQNMTANATNETENAGWLDFKKYSKHCKSAKLP